MQDSIGVLGFATLGAGLFGRYGWEITAIILGSILLTLAILGAMRR